MKTCSKCKTLKSLSDFNTQSHRLCGYRSECKACQYKAHHIRERNHRGKIRAKDNARLATKRGDLVKPSQCEGCGEEKSLDRHHPDYDQQLSVVWLCRKCHSRKHHPQLEARFSHSVGSGFTLRGVFNN